MNFYLSLCKSSNLLYDYFLNFFVCIQFVIISCLLDIILFLNKKGTPIKIDILEKEIWNYSSELETHTVETHVYRLRKKIKDSFNDENFILSDKEGYLIK